MQTVTSIILCKPSCRDTCRNTQYGKGLNWEGGLKYYISSGSSHTVKCMALKQQAEHAKSRTLFIKLSKATHFFPWAFRLNIYPRPPAMPSE